MLYDGLYQIKYLFLQNNEEYFLQANTFVIKLYIYTYNNNKLIYII